VAGEDELVRLLASIDRRLALLTARQARELRKALEEEVLRTSARTRMFDGIDGERGGAELGRLAGVSERAGQLFVKELLDLGLVRPTSEGSRTIERDEDGLLDWYLRRAEGA
jgi:hypothetical protein